MMNALLEDKNKMTNEEGLPALWEKAVNLLKAEGNYSSTAFNIWIGPLLPHSVQGDSVILCTKNEYIKITATARYSRRISAALSKAYGRKIEAKILLEHEAGDLLQNTANTNPINNDTLNKRLNFETFVKGKNNEFAYEASRAVADSPGSLYNPLFLHGDVGVGKTHLMHSVGNFIQERNPQARILYTSTENLVNEFVASLKSKRNQEFRDKYRTVDVFLVDDIQFLSDKESTQEEFFHTFNALYNDNKQIVLTSDKHPFELKTLEERLRSRFNSGLTVDITLPDLETRVAILEMKTELENMPIAKDVLYFIARAIPYNVRELSGALSTVFAKSKLTNAKCTVEMAEQTLSEMKKKESKVIDITYIQEMVCDFYGITPEAIRGKRRNADLAYARHIAMYLCRMYTDETLKNIAKAFGNRDHSTVVHAIEKLTDLMDINKKLRDEVEELKARLKQE